MNHIQLKNISKIYNANSTQAQSAMALLAEGMDSVAVKEQTGYSVGLYDINLNIKAGELHCIMGLSGSGKSTLIRHLNRLIDPTSGEIWVNTTVNTKTHAKDNTQANTAPVDESSSNAINILELNDKQLQHYRQQTVSMVFQHFGLVPHMTVIQNVAYGLRVRKMSVSERHEIARYWLNEVGLTNLEHSYPDELSGGMQQRVGLARALATDNPILLMDEAFSALDPLIRAQLQDQLLELQERLNKTIVFITHDIDEAIKVGQRISILNGGRLVQTGTPSDLRHNPADDYVEQFMRAKA
ncbi:MULTISPECIES: ATP-binding cassette domain-containing protein [Psychrobacter]|uniref:ABC transporter ATP-binding protein n=2 Tax=Psychrobacter TaxID=497 RepID=A0A1G6ZL34_9GAMM|nr:MULTISPECIES: ATP-binding cassette domain-containing protein [Psychrobacter]MED6317908.1 ATP-binding cassette domain-containing protein [Pseudomonadota bacterium]HBD03363.1 ABC transporter ATP-binding protein [Psychrobacter sp.]MBZ1391653.1 ATP-binding cassette domain-containing protein [Psychrobacter pacificensis]MDH4904584.1 ABC transporter ATP-binding protein [Psychrobacter pocilloporae]SDE02276.1 glycine betaine/proline transport system ATP-binding protein [Psychrobacter pacificensis]